MVNMYLTLFNMCHLRSSLRFAAAPRSPAHRGWASQSRRASAWDLSDSSKMLEAWATAGICEGVSEWVREWVREQRVSNALLGVRDEFEIKELVENAKSFWHCLLNGYLPVMCNVCRLGDLFSIHFACVVFNTFKLSSKKCSIIFNLPSLSS